MDTIGQYPHNLIAHLRQREQAAIFAFAYLDRVQRAGYVWSEHHMNTLLGGMADCSPSLAADHAEAMLHIDL